jgi:hypothetical protein
MILVTVMTCINTNLVLCLNLFFNLALGTKLTISNMERGHLSLDESNRTIGILGSGMSQADVVNTFNVRQSVILRLQQGYRDTETVPERRREKED